MLGLNTKKGRRGALAIALTSALLGLGISAAAAADPHAEADASAIHATGEALKQVLGPVLDGGTCTAVYPGTPNGAPADKCGDNLNLGTPQTPVAYSQDAKAGAPANSAAGATVGAIAIPGLDQSLDLNNVINGITSANTSDVLNAVTDQVLKAVIDALKLLPGFQTLIDSINSALQQALTALNGVVTVEVRVGAVESKCTATPTNAQGYGTVDGIHLFVTLGGGATSIDINIPVATAPNSQLVGSVPDITDQLLTGVANSLKSNQTLNGQLAALGGGVETLQSTLIDSLLDPLKGPLTQLGDALAPLVKGTVNEQSPAADLKPVNGAGIGGTDHGDADSQITGKSPQITVTALDVVLFQGTPLEGGLQLAKVHCGRNSLGNITPNGPGLRFDKDAKVKGSDTIKYTLTVFNQFTHAVDNVFVQDFYSKDIDPKDIKNVQVSAGSFDKDSGKWTVGTVAAGATEKLTFEVKVSKKDLDNGIKNAACVNKSSKPANIQKNKGAAKDTDGCDEITTKHKKKKKHHGGHNPKSVDSGINDGGDLGPLGVTGLLAASTLIGAATRQRLLLNR